MPKSKAQERVTIPPRNIPVMLLGVAFLFHAGYLVMQMRRATAHHVLDSIPIMTPQGMQVLVELIIGGMAALYGSIGGFDPIRVGDAPKPKWDAQHIRPEYVNFGSRAGCMRGLLYSQVKTPPAS